jgi:hypothetical protein
MITPTFENISERVSGPESSGYPYCFSVRDASKPQRLNPSDNNGDLL